ncbi:hypothetical protein DFH29DRAFT_920690 [Suillus ampliporus]|nr:hypothetical protein DFH29DRAFT_920690 [Suillus ampliporus]
MPQGPTYLTRLYTLSQTHRNDVIEGTDGEDEDEDVALRYNSIKSAINSIDNDNEDEMSVDNMLVSTRPQVTKSQYPIPQNHLLNVNSQTEPAPEPNSSSSAARSLSHSLDMVDSLFTPPPPLKHRRCVILDYISVPPLPKGMNRTDYKSSNASSRAPQQGVVHRRRVILDYISVPPLPKGMNRTDYKSSNASSRAPQQGVVHPSVSHALAAAFAQNEWSPSPPLSRKGKERERAPPAPVRPKRKYKPSFPRYFGDGVSTVPTRTLDAQYPASELEIHEIPEFSPYTDNV